MTELHQMIAQVIGCKPEELSAESELGITPGWDSMAYLRILTELEKQYHVELNEQTVQHYRKFSHILELATEKTHE